MITLQREFIQNLFATNIKSSINQKKLFNGGVAQLVRARDS